MKARNRGESIETTEGASCSSKNAGSWRDRSLGRDEAVEGVLGYGDEAAEVERHRIHRQALAAVVKHGVSERGVVPEHLVAHCVTFV